MRIIPTSIHGIVDYLAGLLLIAAPWLFGFANEGAETWVPVGAGLLMLGASLMTDYEWGLFRIIPMPVHLGLDALLGIVLAASPWIFNFNETVYIPHVVLGLGELAGALMTQTQPTRRTGPASLGH
jgi:hypothetical protein